MQAGTIVAIFFISGGALAGIVMLTIALDRSVNYRRRKAQKARKCRQLRLQKVTGEIKPTKASPSWRSRLSLPAPPRLPLTVLPQKQKQQNHEHWPGSKTEKRNSLDRNFDDNFIINEAFNDWDKNGPSDNWAVSRRADGDIC